MEETAWSVVVARQWDLSSCAVTRAYCSEGTLMPSASERCKSLLQTSHHINEDFTNMLLLVIEGDMRRHMHMSVNNITLFNIQETLAQ